MEKEDKELINEFLNGKEEALSVLVHRYSKSIFNFALRFTNDSPRAEDVTQETFVKMWKHLERFRPDENFRSWLFTIARNTALDHIRKKKSLPFSFLSKKDGEGNLNAFEDTLSDTEPTPEEFAVLTEQKEYLNNALIKLSSSHQEVLFLRYNEGLTFDEIGTALGKPLDTVKSQHRRALITLQKLLRKQDY